MVRKEILKPQYDPEQGDPENGIAPGTKFENLPDDWVCPPCGALKSDFEKKLMDQNTRKLCFLLRSGYGPPIVHNKRIGGAYAKRTVGADFTRFRLRSPSAWCRNPQVGRWRLGGIGRPLVSACLARDLKVAIFALPRSMEAYPTPREAQSFPVDPAAEGLG